MANITLTRGKTLPDSGVKNDLHELIDLTTATITNITNSDVSSTAAIVGTKISPNFGSQDVTCGAVNSAEGVLLTEATAPTTAANVGALYTKNDGTQTELYFREESDGDEVQVTKGGRVNVGFGAYETTDAHQVGGTGAALAASTEYQSSSDGVVILLGTVTSNPGFVYISAGTSSGALSKLQSSSGTAGDIGTSLVVAKNNYWSANLTNAGSAVIRFKPLL